MSGHAIPALIRIGDRDWLIGAEWSAPTFASKPGNLYTLARQENYDPQATLAAYMRDKLQLGWYIFSDASARPGRTATLAGVLLEQLARRAEEGIKFPLTAIFNLGECYWLIIFDANRNIVPGFDLWGTRNEIYGYLDDPEHAGTIEPFRENTKRFDDEQTAISWLFDGMDRNYVYAEPLRPSTAGIRIAALAFGALAIAGVSWHFVSASLEARHEAAERAKFAEMQEQLKMQEQARTAEQKLQQTEFNDRLEAYWQNYPQPWVGAAPASVVLTACQASIDADLPVVDGWSRSDAACTPTGSQMVFSEKWDRGKLATVFSMPQQAVFEGEGNIAQTQRSIAIDPPLAPPGSVLADPNDLHVQWVGTGQRYEGVMKTDAGPFVPFKPPVPPWVPQSKVQQVELETPVLWQQETVKITSSFAPWDGWPLPTSPTFILGSITVKYAENGPTWTLNGVQYAR
jgi:hypothetical protein